MALRVKVCRVDDVPPGAIKGFAVDGADVPVLVANVAGTLYAASSMCPHEDVSLLDGDLEDTRIQCHGHGYMFELATGACTHDPALFLSTYRTTIVDDCLYVDLV